MTETVDVGELDATFFKQDDRLSKPKPALKEAGLMHYVSQARMVPSDCSSSAVITKNAKSAAASI